MKIRACFLFFLFLSSTAFLEAQTTVILQENFTNYLGTSATVPAGWNFSYNGNYTSVSFSGTSGPNSYQFGANNASIVTPAFTNADSVLCWMKGASTDSASYLTIDETSDSIVWTNVALIKPLPTTGTTFRFQIQNSSVHLRFTYTKSSGNLAFDDFVLLRDSILSSSGWIKTYFNHPVNNSVSNGVNAIFLNQTADDTLVRYIDSAKYSIDVAVYNYSQSASIANISGAINNAYNRGVKIRWIYDGSSTNSGLSQLDTNINTFASPTSGNYGIMHNKFIIVDAQSPNPDDAIVWTGSTNWNYQQFYNDVNNIIIIQDKNIANAYTTEFNEMWGDTGLVPDTVLSRFGPYKSNNTFHTFYIGGKKVELYFSPTDSVNSHLLSSLSSANDDLYFGIYAFNYNTTADSIMSRVQSGVYTAGIMDAWSQSYATYTTLQAVMGSNLKVFANTPTLYHNKFLIADPCNTISDPLVFTGSYNWTNSAETKNDENILIIHDDTIANIYYQSFNQNFLDMGGALVPCVSSGLNEISEEELVVYPNPSSGKFQVASHKSQVSSVEIFNVLGEKIYEAFPKEKSAVAISLPLELGQGIYFLKTIIGGKHFTRKIIIQH